MKISKICAATLFLMLMAFANLAFAQQKPAATTPSQEMLMLMQVQVKPGMGLEWENYFKKDLVPALKKAGMKQLNASKTSAFGVNDQYVFWYPITSLAELDGPSPMEKALGPGGLPILLANMQRCVASASSYMIVSVPGIQIPAKPDYVFKMALVVKQTVAPGRNDEFEKGAKDALAVLAKTNAKGVYLNKTGLGGNPNEYIWYIPLDNFADLEKFGPAFSKAASEAKLSPQAGIVTGVDMQMHAILPELGIQQPAP